MKQKKVVAGIFALALLCLCACSSAPAPQTESFEGITVDIPGDWVSTDLGTTETVTASNMWRVDDGNEAHEITDGGVVAYRVPYDVLNNLDVGLSNYTYDDTVRETEAFAKATIKSTDARLMTSYMIGVYSNAAPEEDFKLEGKQGHAVWSYEGPGKNGTDFARGIPFDDYILVVFAICPEGQDVETYRTILDSIAFTESCDEQMLEVSAEIEGGTSQEAIQHVADVIGELKVPIPSSSSSGKSSASSQRPKSSSSSADDLELVDQFDTSNGIGFQGNDGNYYFKNDDGSYEATDGWGNGVRDEDGDGEPDMWTDDGGETWHRY